MTVGGELAKPGDAIIVTGDIGRHGCTILLEREDFGIDADVTSDCAPLWKTVLYLANIGSCIDVFDVHTLKFITRIGNRNWGHGNAQLFHTHAMAIVNDYIIVRMKDGLQVTLQSDVSAEKIQ